MSHLYFFLKRKKKNKKMIQIEFKEFGSFYSSYENNFFRINFHELIFFDYFKTEAIQISTKAFEFTEKTIKS